MMTTPEIRFRHQDRKSLAMRVTTDGLLVLLPRYVEIDSPEVQEFVQEGLRTLPRPMALSPDQWLTPEELRAMVDAWAGRIGVEVKRLQIRAMRRKWGSCSSRGVITLSTDLLRLPRELVEYVICHELVHRLVPGHNKTWKLLMDIHLPDWRARERQLEGWTIAGWPLEASSCGEGTCP